MPHQLRHDLAERVHIVGKPVQQDDRPPIPVSVPQVGQMQGFGFNKFSHVSFRAQKRIVPGIGHPFHQPINPGTPRLFELARETGRCVVLRVSPPGLDPDQRGQQPIGDSRTMQKWNQRAHLITRRGLMYSLALCLLILIIGGVGFWILEPRAETLADGLWLAFTTAATVGYGDIIPSTHASRAFAVVVVLLGLAVLSLVTASVAAMLVETEERQIERDLMREIGGLRSEVRALRDELRATTRRDGAH